ncbi:hypothetical protein ROT00_04150 [Agromyces mediolanus]|uniref:hypothetical protein n=1 Tax=Agromyces mediolanus TaxID=41986 RepID=UPI0038346C8C
MNSPLRVSLIVVAAVAALALTGCTGQPSPSPTASSDAAAGTCSGVTVIVDPGNLDVPGDASVDTCVVTEDPIIAADALARAGVETEGTVQYGDQVVCRVNGVPAQDFAITAADGSEYHESCESMPAAFAYWALWQKPADGEWGYAQEGLGTLELQPGDAVELLFTLNDEPAAPAE